MNAMKQWFRLFKLKIITLKVLTIYLKSPSETPGQTLCYVQGPGRAGKLGQSKWDSVGWAVPPHPSKKKRADPVMVTGSTNI